MGSHASHVGVDKTYRRDEQIVLGVIKIIQDKANKHHMIDVRSYIHKLVELLVVSDCMRV